MSTQNDPNFGASLGILRNYEPVTVGAASSPWLINPDSDFSIQSQDQNSLFSPSVLEPSFDHASSENRTLRFQRQSAARRLLYQNRVAGCIRYRLNNRVKVLKSSSSGKCHYGDLMICGSVWDCPICSAKISETRRVELTQAVKQFTASGGFVYLVTFTYPHQREDNLKELLAKQKKAMEWFYRHRDYKDSIKGRFKQIGRVRALEITHGQANGWHPHVHELWFMDEKIIGDTLKAYAFRLWLRACEKFGLGLPTWEHGVDIRGGDYASKYITKFGEQPLVKKWGIENEITRFDVKKGRNKSRSPFQLLDDYIQGDKQAGALFIDYSQAFKGSSRLHWSRGLKAKFDIKEFADDEISVQVSDSDVLLSKIDADEWAAILRTSTPKLDNRSIVLRYAEQEGVDVMNAYISQLVAIYRDIH